MSIKQKSLPLPLLSRTITYTLRRSKRARRMRLTVRGDGVVVLTVPARVPSSRLFPWTDPERFVLKHAAWIEAKLAQFAQSPRLRLGPGDYLRHKDRALGVGSYKS